MCAAQFPDGFLWGSATAAYQVEGSPLADGAGPSIWHRFVHTPGLVRDGDTGDVACDHYRRWAEDVALMRRLGLQAYRFSVSWSRILAGGHRGREWRRVWISMSGLSMPCSRTDRAAHHALSIGTCPRRSMIAAVGSILRYRSGLPTTRHHVPQLDGRVKKWATLNEPWVVTDGGYLHGALAPGHRNRFEAPIASHNLLRAHGAAVQAYRAAGRNEIGLVVNIEPKYQASDDPADRAAIARAEAYMNRQYLDPVFFGRYPEEMADIFGEAWPEWPAQTWH